MRNKFNLKAIFNGFISKTEATPKKNSFNNYVWNSISNLSSDITLQNCIKFRSEALSKMPIKLVQKSTNGTKELQQNNLYYKLFARPNKQEDATSFFCAVERDRLLKGTAYVKINRDNRGNLLSLIRLNPSLIVEPVVTDNLEMQEELIYIYNSTKGTIKISSEDLLIFKNGIDNNNPIKGESCLNPLGLILESNLYGAKSVANINKNGINSAVKVSIEDTINAEMAEKIVGNAINSARGYVSSGVILEENGVKISPFEVNLQASQFLEIYKANQCSILSYFGLSASMLNIEQSTGTYTNSDSQYLDFLKNTMLFVMEQYINELNYKLLSSRQQQQGFTFEFDTTGVLKVDYRTLVDTTANLVQGSVISINEARGKVGLGTTNDGENILVNGSYVGLDQLGIAYEVKAEKTPLKGGEN